MWYSAYCSTWYLITLMPAKLHWQGYRHSLSNVKCKPRWIECNFYYFSFGIYSLEWYKLPNCYFAYGHKPKRMFVIFNNLIYVTIRLYHFKHFPDLSTETNLIFTDFKVTNSDYNIRKKFANYFFDLWVYTIRFEILKEVRNCFVL